MATDPVDASARLYAEASQGDARAAENLLQSYLPRLRAFVRASLTPDLRARESVSDVVQSVCREILEHKANFRYQGEAQFRGFLFTAAANKVKEKFRFHHQPKRDVRRENAPVSAAPPPLAHSSASPSFAALAHERVEMLEAALDQLSEGDRQVISLARLAGLPIAEVAQRLGKTEVAVRKQLGRALTRLAAVLTGGKPETAP